MIEPIDLPDDDEALVRSLNAHFDREERAAYPMHLLYELARMYFAGYRRFTTLNMDTGQVIGEYTDEDGALEFQHQELLKIVNENASKFASLDWSPAATRDDTSLSGLRERAIAQIQSDAVIRSHTLNSIKPQASFMFSAYGSIGFTGHLLDHPTIGLTSDIEIIHPRNLFPFPSVNRDYTQAKGICRQRTVPVSFLKTRYGKKVTGNMNKLDGGIIQYGETLDLRATRTLPQPGTVTNLLGQHRDEDMEIARVREVYVEGVGGTLTEYAAFSGDLLLERQKLHDVEVYNPIGFARFMETGGWKGAGLFHLMFGICRESEKLIKRLFNNINDLDRYGVVLLPQGVINERATLKEIGKGLRVFFYDAEPTGMQDIRPITISPSNSGDIPGKTATFAEQLISSLNPVRDLVGEKGRVESSSGLAVLREEINTKGALATHSFSTALGGVYRSLVARVNREIIQRPRPIKASRLTLDLAGAIIDPKDNSVSFPENPIPDMSMIQFGMRETAPKNLSVRRQEAMGYLAVQGLTDPDAVKILMLKEGLDPALWLDQEQADYESTIRDLLILFGDGEEPGLVGLHPMVGRPDFRARIAASFISRPIVQQASVDVQEALYKYLETCRGFMQGVLPDPFQNPADTAMIQAQQQQQQPQLAQ